MDGVGIGAVGAAMVPGLLSVLGLIIGKEQKVSEFRQSWINDLRACVIAYMVNLNAVCDAYRLKKSGSAVASDLLLEFHRKLNEASHGIRLRVNESEEPSKRVLAAMDEFERLAQTPAAFTPERIKAIEEKFVDGSRQLLKFEWTRVKRGESIFVWSKYLAVASLVILGALMVYLWLSGSAPQKSDLGLFHLV